MAKFDTDWSVSQWPLLHEIQSICSILSVVVIGIISLFIAAQNNKLVEMIKDLENELDGKREYMGTCILLDDLLKTREKACWFLKSLSK